MARALQLARRGLNTTTPNPRVGCVLVRDDKIIAEGWHRRAGEAHAEAHALQLAGPAARGATAYISLEPCSHSGRTPPCADALIAAGIKRVVCAMTDPNPAVSGRGLAKLNAAGVSTRCGLLEEQARELNLGFISRMSRGRPWIRLKAAATLDGKTALENGVSQWITGPQARRDGHAWRARACAILTGIGTVLHDDPQLNVRAVPCERQPLRILVDARLEVPLHARILQDGPILIASASADPARQQALVAAGHQLLILPDGKGRVALDQLLAEFAVRELNEIHVEAGAGVNGALLTAGLVDELLLYLAPKLVGDAARGLFQMPALQQLDAAHALDLREVRMLGQDLRLIARLSGR